MNSGRRLPQFGSSPPAARIAAGRLKEHVALFQALLAAPVQVQPGIAGSDVIVLGPAELARGPIDPRRTALQLQEHADRRFVQGRYALATVLFVLGPKLLVPENGAVAQPLQNRRHSLLVGELDLEFLAALVTRDLRRSFVGQDAHASRI